MVKGTAAKGRDVTSHKAKRRTASFAFSFICALVALFAFAGTALAGGQPSLTSDNATYAPGDTVTLSGSGFAADDAVHLEVDDDAADAWTHEADVTADADGSFSATLTLPELEAGFSATAAGGAGASATASFAAAAPAPPPAATPCAPTGMESVATDRDGYQPGETVHITGSGYAAFCSVQVDVERPDGVVESFPAETGLGGALALDYLLPPFPGINGDYTVRVRGLGGAELATIVFADAPAPQFDIAPNHVAATGTHTFTTLVRNVISSSADTARCIRVTTPSGVTVTGATFTIANPGIAAGQTGNWALTTGTNHVQVRTGSNSVAGIFGMALNSNNWVRFEITVNATTAGTNSWTARMVTSGTADCASGGSSDTLGVSVAQVMPRTYTGAFHDPVTNVAMPLNTMGVVQGTTQQFRVRITRTGGTDDLQRAGVALPSCLTNITAVSMTHNGGANFIPELSDNFFMLTTFTGTKMDANGDWAQLHFTATVGAGCALGNHSFRTVSWKNQNPETAPGDIFQLAAGGSHPTLTVLNANVAPVCANDSGSTNEDTQLSDSVVCTDADGNTLTYSVVSSTLNGGTLNFNPNGSFTYDPAPNYFGPASFTFKANDGTADSNVATYSITVNSVNDAPVANNDTYGPMNEDSILAVPDPVGVLANDTDVESNSLTVATYTQPASGGSVAVNANGGFAYTPALNFCGTDTFTYQASDGQAQNNLSNVATVSITVTCQNDAPTVAANNATVTVNEGQAATNEGTYNDPDGNPVMLTASVGTIVNNNDGTWSWSYATTDGPDNSQTVTITASDGTASSQTTFSLVVNNVAPTVVVSGASSANEGETKSYTYTVTDPGQDTFTVDAGFPNCGTGGTIVGTPTVHASGGAFDCSFPDGPDTTNVTVKVTDSDGLSTAASQSVQLVAIANVAPTVAFLARRPRPTRARR